MDAWALIYSPCVHVTTTTYGILARCTLSTLSDYVLPPPPGTPARLTHTGAAHTHSVCSPLSEASSCE